MKNKLILIVTLCLSLQTNIFAQQDSNYFAGRNNALVRIVKTSISSGYVLDSRLFSIELSNVLKQNKIGFWNPKKKHIKRLERQVFKYIATNMQVDDYVRKNLQNYLRQYYGYLDSAGNKMILVNLFKVDSVKDDYEPAKKYYINSFDGLHSSLILQFDCRLNTVVSHER